MGALSVTPNLPNAIVPKAKPIIPRVLKKTLLACVALFLLASAATAWWVLRPLPMTGASVDLSIEPQTSVRGISQQVVESGIDIDPDLLYWFFRASGQSRALRAGSYEIQAGQTVLDLLRKLNRGEESLRAFALIDGWTFRQVRAALARAEGLRRETEGLSDEDIMRRLGRSGVAAEGRFYPDTYTYGKGSSDLRLLDRAARAMDRQLAKAWAERDTAIVLRTPEEVLTLASIVEKETGLERDRGMISRVFHNRLALGMPLQTDPTVIYGLGERFDGTCAEPTCSPITPGTPMCIAACRRPPSPCRAATPCVPRFAPLRAAPFILWRVATAAANSAKPSPRTMRPSIATSGVTPERAKTERRT